MIHLILCAKFPKPSSRLLCPVIRHALREIPPRGKIVYIPPPPLLVPGRLALGFRRFCQRRRLKEGDTQYQPLWQPIFSAAITPRSHVGSLLLCRGDQPLHVLSDEVDIMDSNSFAREHLLHRGLGYSSDRASTDSVGMESPPLPQSYGGFRFSRDSAPTVEGGGTATGSSEADCGVDGVHTV